jgi:hypothetical protein
VTPPAAGIVISGDQALAEFRGGLTGPRAFELLATAAGRLLVQLPVGVGKSAWLVATAAHAPAARPDALVVVLTPRWDVLRELRRGLAPAARPVVLYPRPRRRCGELDAEWEELESRGCGLLGRERLCGRCPHRKSCSWPDRQADELDGARLVLATQQHLAVDPYFLARLRVATGAANTLLLLDESDLLLRPFRRAIPTDRLEVFAAAEQAVVTANPDFGPVAGQWAGYTDLVRTAPTEDLRAGGWDPPPIQYRWALAVQRAGRHASGNDFFFLAYDLAAFARSDPVSRERTAGGGLAFAALPDLSDEAVIVSGSVATGLAGHRLDPDRARPRLVSPFAGHRFVHPGTRWFNLPILEGAAKYFAGNSGRLLDFFARLVARNVDAGRRTLLIARKRFLPVVQREMRARLRGLGVAGVRVVTRRWARHDLSDPRTVPLISYGICGVNRFEEFDAAYCVTGYYAPAAAVEGLVNDLEPSDRRVPVRLELRGHPRRRVAVVADPAAAHTVAPMLAREALVQKEADVVVQAVGRVRPFTRPREVITLHMGDLPTVCGVTEFHSLAAARADFGLPTPAEADRADRVARAARLRAAGKSVAEIALELGVSDSTAKRYLRRTGGHTLS